MPLHRALGKRQGSRRFRDAESGEEPQHNDLRLRGKLNAQPLDGFIQREDRLRHRLRREIEDAVQFHRSATAAAFVRAFAPGVLHEHLTHRLRGRAKKMPPVLPLRRAFAAATETQPRLVHQFRGLERGCGFAAQTRPGQPAQLFIDQCQQLRLRAGFTPCHAVQNRGERR